MGIGARMMCTRDTAAASSSISTLYAKPIDRRIGTEAISALCHDAAIFWNPDELK